MPAVNRLTVRTEERRRRVRAGAEAAFVYTVANGGTRALRVRPVIADVRPADAEEWLTLPPGEIDLPPGGEYSVAVVAAVPSWEEKGETAFRLLVEDVERDADDPERIVGEGPPIVIRVPVNPARLLPEVFRSEIRDGPSPLAAYLEAMSALHESAEDSLERAPRTFDPHRCPDAFVPMLARWVGLAPLLDQRGSLSTGLGRLRDLVSRSADITRRRGTRSGLLLTLTTATGATSGPEGFEIDEPEAFHVRVRAPRAERAHERLIRGIIESVKPASVTYELVFDR